MKRTVLVVLLAACQASTNDYPTGPGGPGPPVRSPGGCNCDAGVDGGDAGDGGDGGVLVPVHARVCIVSDLRTPTVCDPRGDASRVTVTLGNQRPDAAPAKTGEFTIQAELGTHLSWQVTGAIFIPTVMPYGTDTIIPLVPDQLYNELLLRNGLTVDAVQGSVVVRVLSGGLPAPNVTATSTLISTSNNTLPVYDEDNSPTDWRPIGPTAKAGIIWFAGADVTTTPATITLRPPVGSGGLPVSFDVRVVPQTITFVTKDLL
jgi:hypothetical protein